MSQTGDCGRAMGNSPLLVVLHSLSLSLSLSSQKFWGGGKRLTETTQLREQRRGKLSAVSCPVLTASFLRPTGSRGRARRAPHEVPQTGKLRPRERGTVCCCSSCTHLLPLRCARRGRSRQEQRIVTVRLLPRRRSCQPLVALDTLSSYLCPGPPPALSCETEALIKSRSVETAAAPLRDCPLVEALYALVPPPPCA